MVTHDPIAASHADSVIFLADGRIVDRIDGPHGWRGAAMSERAQQVLDRITALGK
jgi:putative ABC transport system ATP-binding protein